jgi:acetyltransferase-like isoleucine patch superfamily enzyme
VGADAVVPPRASARGRRRLWWLRLRSLGRVRAAGDVRLGRRVRVRVVGRGRVVLGDGCAVCDDVRLEAVGGVLAIGPGSVVGDRAVLLAGREGTAIGAECVVGAWAHVDAGARLADRARLAAHASAGPGARIGRGAVIGSYAVVAGVVAPGAVVEHATDAAV